MNTILGITKHLVTIQVLMIDKVRKKDLESRKHYWIWLHFGNSWTSALELGQALIDIIVNISKKYIEILMLQICNFVPE